MLEQDNISRIKILLKAHPRGLTITDVSQNLKINRNSAAKYLEILQISGIVESKSYGTAKVYFLTHRLPISALVSITADLVVTLNENHRILFVNDSFCTFFEVKKEDVAGSHIVEIFKKGIGRDVLPGIFSDIIAGKEEVHEVRISQDTSDFFFKIKSMKTVFDDGSRGVTILMEDVTRETKDRAELEAKEARYRGIVEDQTDFVVRFLPDGTLSFVNTSFCRFLGKDHQNLLGTPFSYTIHPKDRQEFGRSLATTMQEKPVVTFECCSELATGTVHWIAWTIRAMYNSGREPVEYQAVGHDITEKKKEADFIGRHLSEMEFFSAKLQQFIELPPGADIYQVIGNGFSEILPIAAVCVSNYDPATSTLTIKTVCTEHDKEVFTEYIGRDIIGLNIPAGDGSYTRDLLSGQIFSRKGTLSDIIRQQVPESTCAAIENTLNLGEYYSVGLTWRGALLGAVTFSVRKGADLEHKSVGETYVRAASIALQRSLAESALAESEQLYRSVLDNIQDVFYRSDKEGNLLMISPSGRTMLGYSMSDEIEGRSIARDFYFNPEKRKDLIDKITAEGSVSNYEVILKKKDGTRIFIETNSHLFYDRDGSPLGVEGIFRDITERKESERKIQQYIGEMEFLSQKLLDFITMPPDESIYEKILSDLKAIVPDATILVNSFDQGTGIVTVECAAMTTHRRDAVFRALSRDLVGSGFPIDSSGTRTFRKGRLEAANLPLFEIAFRSIPEPICDKLEKELDFGNKYTIGLIHRGEIMGNATFIMDKGHAIPDPGLIEMYAREAAIALQHSRAEKALAESEVRYRTVLDNIQDVFYRSDISGDLIMASPSWARILGYTSLDECLGKSIAQDFWLEPEKREVFLGAVMSKGSVTDYEVVLKKKDGTPLQVSTNSHVYYDKDGMVLGVEGIFRDISERKEAERKINQYIGEMEFISQKLLEFISMDPSENIYQKIAGDLNTMVPEGSLVAVNSYDTKTGILTVEAAVTTDRKRETIIRLMGREPAGSKFRMNETSYAGHLTGKLYNVGLPLYEVLSRNIPEAVCRQLESELTAPDVYTIGFVRSDEVLGSATIFLERGKVIENLPIVETYAREASIALQRYLAEEARRKSDEVFLNFTQNSPFPIALIKEDGTFQYINESFSQLFGYDLNDFHTLTEWFCLIFPDPAYRKQIVERSELDRSQPGPRPALVGAYPVRCKDSIVREVISRRIILSGGMVCVICEDMTERNKAEQTQRLLSSIITSTSDAVIAKDTRGTIISWNQAAEKLYGYSGEEMIGQDISRIIPSDRIEEMEGIFRRVERGESISNLETRRIRKDGKFVDVSVTVSPIMDDAGTVTGASTIARDITRHKAEERLRENEEQYRSLVENISVGFYRSTGDPTGRFIWGNSSLVRILGYPSFEQLSEVGIADIFVEQDGRKRLLDDLKKEGFVKNREIALRKADGKTVSVLVTALARFDQGGNLSCINGIVVDITGQKEAEDRVQIKDKQMQDILACVPYPVVITDHENCVIAWNAAMEQLTGIQKGQVAGRDDYEHLLPFNDPARPSLVTLFDATDEDLDRSYPGAYRQGTAITAPVRDRRHQEDPPVFLTVRASPLSDSEGVRIGAVQIIQPATPIRTPELRNSR